MKTRFSKPLGDVSIESGRIASDEGDHLQRERTASALLSEGDMREACALCAEPLQLARPILHRGIPYLFCSCCGHLQSSRLPTPAHAEALARLSPFHAIYPELDPEAYRSRVDRIYRPKLDWILEAAFEAGMDPFSLRQRKWVEIGCGAGYFLQSLKDAGMRRFQGLDRDARLVDTANRVLGAGSAAHYEGPLSEAVARSDAGAIAAFFVLEHTDDLPALARALRAKPKGTMLAFSVPVFGMGTLLESGFDHFFARNLDSGVHTQLFTDRSITRFLEDSGFEAVSRWVFGQDASDFIRMLVGKLASLYPADVLEPVQASLHRIQDELQGALDRNLLADSRHVLAARA